MNKIFCTLIFLLFVSATVLSQTPAITITLNESPDDYFWCSISAVTENTIIKVDFGDNTLTNFNVGTTNSSIYGTFKGNTIKIYGVGISRLWLQNKNCTAIDVLGATDLKDLTCQYTQITTLDLSKNTALTLLNITQNQLINLDLSQNLALTDLVCEKNQISSINLTKNTLLKTLECSNNLINSLDVSQNSALTKLDCNYNLLTSLDVSKNKMLSILWCSFNRLKVLDASQNNSLTAFFCSYNYLTVLKAPISATITLFYCESNLLNFTSLPVKQPEWSYYTYHPQGDIKLPKRKFLIGEVIDLSDHLNSNGNTTIYTWKTISGNSLIKGVDYYEDNGKFSFIVNQDSPIYCKMTNSSFPGLTLSSEKITIPSSTIAVTMNTGVLIGNSFSFEIASNTDNNNIQVDWGDRILSDYTINSSISIISGTVAGDTIKIYGLGITFINLQSKDLTLLDVSEATELENLICKSNNLSILNLSNNASLNTLQCQSNQLTTLNLSNNNELTRIQCQLNQIRSLVLPKNITLTDFQCQFNQLTFSSIPTKQADWINYIYYPQSTIKLPHNKYDGEFVDLSNQLLNLRTVYNWKTKGGSVLISGTDYVQTSGKFFFIKDQNDSIFCEITNTTFPYITLKTTAIAFVTTPSISFTIPSSTGGYIAFQIKTKEDETPILVDLGNSTYSIMNCNHYGAILNETSKSNTIKIFGKYITYFSSSINITSLDVTNVSELTYLGCGNNNLTSLDVTKNPLLTEIYSNSCKLTNLDLSNNKMLTTLSCEYNQLNTLDLSKNTSLKTLYCSYNNLTNLDVSKNKALTILYCNNNQLTTLEATNDTSLTQLQCNSNQLTVLDVSNCKNLKYIFCYSNKLNNLNLTNNILLENLDCQNNLITKIDVTNNPQLHYLNCSNNQLTTIVLPNISHLINLICSYNKLSALDLTATSSISSLNCNNNQLIALKLSDKSVTSNLYCSNNMLNFSTLPLIAPSFISCYPQASYKLAKNIYQPNDTIDLSSQFLIDGNTTNYIWKTVSGGTLKKDIDYIENNGKFHFFETNEDYLYCQMTNTRFPEFQLFTDTISIPSPLPLVTISTKNNIGSDFSFKVSRTSLNKPIRIDWGNSNISDCPVDNYGHVKGIIKGATIKIYGIGLKELSISSQNITNLNLSSTKLLRSLDCHSNQLSSIDISNAISLVALNCSSNHLASLKIQSSSLDWLDCSSNQLSSLDILEATSLKTLNCSSNKFTSLNLSSKSLRILDCSFNQLTSLNISGTPALNDLDCNTNNLAFNTLPDGSTLGHYIYIPQNTYKLPKTSYSLFEDIDLSSQYYINGYTTIYSWNYRGILTTNVYYNEKNGVFQFLNTCKDVTYFCVMTNSSFPNLYLYTEIFDIIPSTSILTPTYNVTVFPNPFKEQLNIECEENITRVEIYSLAGTKVYERQGDNSSTMNLYALDLPKGMLIVKIYCKNKVIERKVIKK